LIKHVSRDLDVGHAFETVEKKPIPYFSQFSTAALTPAAMRSALALRQVEQRPESQQAASAPAALEATQKVAAGAAAEADMGGEQPVAAAAPDVLEATVPVNLESMAKDSQDMLALAKAEKVHARNQTLASKQLEERTLQELFRDDKFFYSASDILENTMSNLVYEASFGEFEITKVPRVIASVVDKD